MKIAESALAPKSSQLKSSLKKQRYFETVLLLLVLISTVVLCWLPYLLRSNLFELPLLNDTYNQTYTTGFYDNDPSGLFRWTKAEATIQLPSTLLPEQLTLNPVKVQTEKNQPPEQTIELLYNGKSVGTFKTTDHQPLKMDIPQQWQWTGGTLIIKISPTFQQPIKEGTREAGIALGGLEEVAAPAPPLGLWSSALAIAATLFWASLRLFPQKAGAPRPVGKRLAFVAAPVLVLIAGWNLDRVNAQANLGWYALILILLTFVLAFRVQLFPTPVPKPQALSWQLNGGFTLKLAAGWNSWENYLYANKLGTVNKFLLYLLRIGLPVTSILIGVWFQYSRVFTQNYGFYWDDYHIARPWSLNQLASTFVGTWDPLHLEPEYYRPLAAVSFALDYTLWGFNPFGYHLTNLLLQIGSAILGYKLLRKMHANKLVSLLAIIFFISLPSSSDATVWVSERSDTLALFFMLACLLTFDLYWRYPDNTVTQPLNTMRAVDEFDRNNFKTKAKPKQKTIYYFLANFALVAALGSKETGIILPALIILWTLLFPKNKFETRQLIIFIPPFIVTALYLLLRTLVIHNPARFSLTLETLWQGYTSSVMQAFYGFDAIFGDKNLRSNDLNNLVTFLLLGLLCGFFGWRIFQMLWKKPTLIQTGWQLFFGGLGWIMLSCLPLSLLAATSYGVNQRVFYASGFGFTIIISSVLVGSYTLLKYSKGSWCFWPLVITVFVTLWLVFSNFSSANFSSQKDYAPFADGSNGTLHWDKWILDQPEWRNKIPATQLNYLEQKIYHP